MWRPVAPERARSGGVSKASTRNAPALADHVGELGAARARDVLAHDVAATGRPIGGAEPLAHDLAVARESERDIRAREREIDADVADVP